MLISEHHSEFDTMLNVLDHDFLTTDTMTDESGCAPDSRQSTSQSSRLCLACHSVFERDELEAGCYYYPHHSSLISFIKAAQAGCYVCSSIFFSLPIDSQESLRLLAAGKEPNQMSLEKTQFRTNIKSYSPETNMKILQRYLENLHRGGRIRFVSFTMIGFGCRTPRASVDIYMNLNPLYEMYFPPQMEAYSESIMKMWLELADFYKGEPIILGRSDP